MFPAIVQRHLESERDRSREKQEAENGAEKRVREGEERVREAERERDEARMERDEARMEKDAAEVGRGIAEERVMVVEGERDRVMVELQQALARNNELQQQLGEVERRERGKLVVQEQAIEAEQQGPSWEVREDELEVTGEELGCGGWAKVKVAKLKVAAKVLHEQLIYDYHHRLFRREMDVAARVSHPNLGYVPSHASPAPCALWPEGRSPLFSANHL